MELYLFRHGIAEDAKAGHPDDARALTDEGRKKVAEVVKTARRSGIQPSLIVSSRLVRALQTAQIAADEFNYKGDIVQTANLAPHGVPEKVWDEIREYRAEASLLLASHEPLLGRLAAYLLSSPALAIDVKKAALVRIDIDAFGAVPRGVLRWMLVPKLCG